MSVDCQKLQKQLDDLRDARMRLLMGQGVVTVIDQNGERIEFQKVKLADLENLIRRLEMEYNMNCGLGGNGAYRPIGIYF